MDSQFLELHLCREVYFGAIRNLSVAQIAAIESGEPLPPEYALSPKMQVARAHYLEYKKALEEAGQHTSPNLVAVSG